MESNVLDHVTESEAVHGKSIGRIDESNQVPSNLATLIENNMII